MNFDPQKEEFWDNTLFQKELDRIFDICNGCRLCYNLCPSFEVLFKKIDELDIEASKVPLEVKNEVIDLCYECKLCYPKCPYTPPHHYELDFPRLMLRARAIRTREKGVHIQDKFLGKTDLIGAIGSTFPGIMNWANENQITRSLMHATVGIHKHRNLPKYHGVTFIEWYRKHRRSEDRDYTNGKVALFYTCTVNYNNPDIGIATVEVLERNRIDVIVPEQRCCGMPALDGGDIAAAQEMIDFNTRSFQSYVDAGYTIVVPGPTCSYMMKQEYPYLGRIEGTKRISANTLDICEYLMKLHKEKKLDTAFSAPQGKIAYHLACHLKAQNIGFKSKELMSLIPGTEIELIQKCSAVDGTWGLKKEYYELSLKVARSLFERIEKAQPATVVSDCPLAGLQIEQGTGHSFKHPIQVVRAAYGIAGKG
ncbi:MAG: anaerobic glycerol-3-phosphate dehydrogenase subunit C [Bacteroidota bacterium]